MSDHLQKLIAEESITNEAAHKRLIKQAIREIIDETAATFGRWAFRTLLTAAVGWYIYLWIYLHQGSNK